MFTRISLKAKIYAIAILSLSVSAALINYKHYKSTHTSGAVYRKGTKKDFVKVFTDIYITNEWGQGSGLGSNPENAKPYMVLLQEMLFDPEYTTIVDVGCGDWQLMRNITVPEDKIYTGYDVVEQVIEANVRAYTRDNIHFEHTTSLQDLKEKNISGDLLIIKDVMQHWPIAEIQYFIKNILPRFKYALITNQYDPEHYTHNKDKQMGPVHSVGLLEPPFKLKHAKQLLQYYGPDHKQVLFFENPNLG